jgi:branched-chain amino acid transport system substrate-binding protein
MLRRTGLRALIGSCCAMLCVTIAHAQQVQGVTKNEIVVGTIQDLSGPIAAFGKQARNGLQMRADEINDQGGVNGRHIRLVVEDSGYDPKKALLAAQKLTNSDKVFAILGHIGTAQNMAAMPIQFEKNVINFMPLTGARDMYEPPNKLKVAFSPSYYDQVRTALAFLSQKKKYQRVGILYQDDEFGLEVLRGTESAVKAMGQTLVEKTSFKRGATDFSSQIARLKAAQCDLVVLGTIIRETVGAISEARKTGFNPDFVGTSALYTHLIHVLGGKAVEGLYGVNIVSHPYPDDASKLVRDWAANYKAKFGEDPAVFSVYGYYIMDIFAKAAEKAGPTLTVDTFNTAMENTTFPRDMFGSAEFHITATDRLGNRKVRISQIVNGKWNAVSTLIDPPPGE